VVTWQSLGQDGPSYGVFAQRFDSSASAVGAEFQVNSFTGFHQLHAKVSHDSAGNFVVTWESNQDGDSYGIFAQRFDSSGSAMGVEFQVNSYTSHVQRFPAVSHDQTGNFVVTWGSTVQDGAEYGVFGQRFAGSGSPLGGEFQVNTNASSSQRFPVIFHDLAGNFVVTWESNGQDGFGYGVFGQRFDSSASALGPEFQVNSSTVFGQNYPSISHDSAGNFVVVWGRFQIDSDYDVVGRSFANPVIVTGPGSSGASKTRRYLRE
jgi:hypothetical protein